jgi:DNA primase
VVRVERAALECLLQVPQLVPATDVDQLSAEAFRVPVFRRIHQAIRDLGGLASAPATPGQAWVDAIRAPTDPETARLVTELAVAPVPPSLASAAETALTIGRYASRAVAV